MKALLSKEYAAARRAVIDPNRAIEGEPAPGDPLRFTSSSALASYASPQPSPADVAPFDPDQILNLTTYLTVVDKDHNMVSLTSSLLSGFGSGLVVENGGFFLNDRMRYYYLDPADVNSLHASGCARRSTRRWRSGTASRSHLRHARADTQPQTQLQFFLNVVEFGMPVQLALEQPSVISNSFRDYSPHAVLGKLLTPAMLAQSARRARREGT
jgi:gamma-glutamyltranspeptidase/glutathione hydrolase